MSLRQNVFFDEWKLFSKKGRGQKGILIPALIRVTVGNKGLSPPPKSLPQVVCNWCGLQTHTILLPSALCPQHRCLLHCFHATLKSLDLPDTFLVKNVNIPIFWLNRKLLEYRRIAHFIRRLNWHRWEQLGQ